MSRTYRHVGKNWSFKHNSFQDARNAFLYNRHWELGTDQYVDFFSEYKKYDTSPTEDDYQDRTRHTSLRYPNFTSAYDDVFPSALQDKWREHKKPDYCRKS